jgi:hypothetical protein
MRQEMYAIRKAELRCLYPLYSDIRIVQMNQTRMTSKHVPITINEVGAREICFHSQLKLPVNKHIIWEFQLEHRGSRIMAEAVIDSRSISESGGFYYEAMWSQGEIEGEALQKDLQGWMDQMNTAIQAAAVQYSFFNEVFYTEKQVDLSC